MAADSGLEDADHVIHPLPTPRCLDLHPPGRFASIAAIFCKRGTATWRSTTTEIQLTDKLIGREPGINSR